MLHRNQIYCFNESSDIFEPMKLFSLHIFWMLILIADKFALMMIRRTHLATSTTCAYIYIYTRDRPYTMSVTIKLLNKNEGISCRPYGRFCVRATVLNHRINLPIRFRWRHFGLFLASSTQQPSTPRNAVQKGRRVIKFYGRKWNKTTQLSICVNALYNAILRRSTDRHFHLLLSATRVFDFDLTKWLTIIVKLSASIAYLCIFEYAIRQRTVAKQSLVYTGLRHEKSFTSAYIHLDNNNNNK